MNPRPNHMLTLAKFSRILLEKYKNVCTCHLITLMICEMLRVVTKL